MNKKTLEQIMKQMNDIQLEDASVNDIERIKKYKSEIITAYANNLSLEEKEKINKYINQTVYEEINDYKNIILNNNIIWSVLVTKKDNDVLLDEIFIEEKYRNKGIGTKIIESIIDNINNNIYLWVYKDNINAIKLKLKVDIIWNIWSS